jgi:mRNA interferase MazF
MSFVPDRGDLVWLDFDPQAGHEHGRRRPALTLGLPVVGVVLADQVRSLDYQVRRAEFIARAPEEVVRSVLTRIRLLLE